MKSEIETIEPTAPSKPRKRKPEPELPMSHDERFWRLYLAAFQGLHVQFELHNKGGFKYHFSEGMEELERSSHLARRAWNSARYACAMFEDDEKAIKAFNRSVQKLADKEAAEEAAREAEEEERYA